MNYYIHVPFCRKKCDYCAFYSCENAGSWLIEKYLRKLEQDLTGIKSAGIGGVPPEEMAAETVFIGGGTPNYLSEKELDNLFAILEENLCFLPEAEVTMEVNPAQLNYDKLAIIRRKVDRLSIGVQSFDAGLRRVLGRDGGNREIYQAVEWAQKLEFPSVNLDLIYNIPGQTVADFVRDLKTVSRAGVTHLSCYSLTNEERHFLSETDGGKLIEREGRGKFKLDDDLADEMWSLIENESGFRRYEISNYAADKKYRCKHNVNVWQGKKLLGFGPAAASFDGIDRYSQAADLERWLNGEPPETDRISPEDRKNEIFAVNLRTVDGWSSDAGEKFFGSEYWTALQRKCEKLDRKRFPGRFDFSDGIKLTENGLRFWDDIALELI